MFKNRIENREVSKPIIPLSFSQSKCEKWYINKVKGNSFLGLNFTLKHKIIKTGDEKYTLNVKRAIKHKKEAFKHSLSWINYPVF